jgi:FKBP-type peptidyl-prolyl cis-trans isomerase SlyD
MQIAPNRIVTIDYTLMNENGTILDSSNGGQPLTYLHGHGRIIPGLESELEGKAAGESLKVDVPPEKGYGPRLDSLIQDLPRNLFKEQQEIRVGMQFDATTEQGPRRLTVIRVESDTVTVDANHPLAGTTLKFEVEVRDVREATREELSHGHAHGPDSDH